MNQVLQGQPMTVFGDGRQTRAFSHVDDVAPLMARAPLVPGALNQVFNVGADTPYSVLELAEEVARGFGVAPNVVHLKERNEVVHAFSDHEKVRRVFDPPPPIDLRSGIARMSAWVKARGPARPVTFSNIEVRKNLPPSWNL
jgi:UDP-glucose 4-epimerase